MPERSRLPIAKCAVVGILAALASGAATASGDSTGPPVSTAQPTAKGLPGMGKQLRTTNGSWSTSATFTHQWLRCNASFVDCTDIPGATAATYTIVAADVGHVLGARVTATNAAGSGVALSSGLGPVEARPPGLQHRPWIKGTKRVGHVLVEAATLWTRSPYMWRDRWLRCSAGGTVCVRIEKGVGTDYKLTRKDAGHRIRIQVTAFNGAGHTSSISAPTRIVKK
jgi:hypothetical protein